MFNCSKRRGGNDSSKKARGEKKKQYKIKYIYKTDSESENSGYVDSESEEVEEPVIKALKVKNLKHKTSETETKESVSRKWHKEAVDTSDKSSDKSDENEKSDLENVSKKKQIVQVLKIRRKLLQTHQILYKNSNNLHLDYNINQWCLVLCRPKCNCKWCPPLVWHPLVLLPVMQVQLCRSLLVIGRAWWILLGKLKINQ